MKLSDSITLAGLLFLVAGGGLAAAAGWWIGPILVGTLLLAHGWLVARHGG